MLARDGAFEDGLQKALASRSVSLLARLTPGSAAQQRTLAAAYRDLNEPKRALAALASGGADEDAADLLEQAQLFAKLERPKDAEEALARAESLRPDAEQRRRIADMRARLAENTRHAQDQRAFAAAKKADDAIEKARALVGRGEKSAARAVLAEAAASAPRGEQIRRIAGVYADLGDFKGALVVLSGLGASKDPDALVDRARYLAALGRAREALSDLDAASALGLDDSRGARAALVYQDLKEYRRAAALLEKAAAARPDDPGLRTSLGVCEVLSGQDDKAAATLEGVVAAHPEFLPAYLTLGFVYERRGDVGGAAALYDRALAQPSAPRFEGARAALTAARDGLTPRARGPILRRSGGPRR